ncbi:LysR family transcriptional regulator [Photobacterium sp. TY1-4]|uniref:LysR family transcriptional regulator n=1 Tax=Photobacterium sp. TY1-4 TaxID=2899122 RepID=UPI0021BF5237|nr:LysR family transcriptional regulator [Photobacterium sp. TY1-4]UXI02707.1 LysR family transcriptional regulator [Photobacterium sp. TY1-4]
MVMYSLDQLQMFVTAARLGSFSASARQLGKVQSAVSQGISNLEIDLNVALFDRSTRKPTLTREGKHLLSFAEAILQQNKELGSAARALSEQEESEICIAVDDHLLVDAFFSLMTAFSQRFPSTSVTTITAASVDIPDLIRHGRATLGLMISDLTIPRDVDIRYIGNLRCIPVAAPDHPLARLDTVTPSDLIPHRQILIKGGKGIATVHQQPLSARFWYADDHRTVRGFIARGLGWTYLPEHSADDMIQAGQAVALAVTFDQKAWTVPVECLQGKGHPPGPALKWLNQALNTLLPG